MENDKPCPCPQHSAPAPVRQVTKRVGHCGTKTFTKSNGEFSHFADEEIRMMEDMIIRFNPRGAEPEQAAPAAETGVTREELLGVLGAIVSALKNFQVNVAAPVVNVSPSLAVEPHIEETQIRRNDKGQMEGSVKIVRPQ